MPRSPSVTGDRATDALVPVASLLVWAVKTGDREQVAEILATHDPTALAVVLAAMVPDDKPMSQLLWWMADPAEYLRLREVGVDSATAGACARSHAAA